MAHETDVCLFVYGSLLDAKNEFGAYMRQHCTRYTEGRFGGELYDVGEYPGVIVKPVGSKFVYGFYLPVR